VSTSRISSPAKTRSLRDLLLFGSATVGIALMVERGLGFTSSMLAARISGPRTFGAYSMALATAGTIAAYAGASIGTTATRFSGQYPRESQDYRKFLSAIALVGATSALFSALLMLIGADPLARWVLRNETLVPILRLAAVSSAAIILYECCRGLLMGQQKFRSQVVLSIIFGGGLVLLLPLAATTSVTLMIAAQAFVALTCVAVCVVFAKPLGISPLATGGAGGPGIRRILGFGTVQSAAFAGVSLATWWVALLVAKSDPTLTQMGLYAIANQFRGVTAMAPALSAQVGYPLLTNESGAKFGGADRVMLTNSLFETALATTVAGSAIILAPWLLLLVYGKPFAGAEAPVLILLATGIVHMSGGPAMQRLSIVRLRALGCINAVWAIALAVLSLWLTPAWGAVGAAVAFLISHSLSQLLIVWLLARLGELPRGYASLTATFMAGSVALAVVAYWRTTAPANSFIYTWVLIVIWLVVLSAIWQIASRTRCLSQWAKKPSTITQDQNDLARS
jgi:O-antigen/teichoic acid export membrane protein